MECCKWEELGLLYSSRELNGKENRDYEEHLKECEDCRNELNLYRREHERFYSPAILGEAPSAKVDAEILRVCSDPRKQAATFSLAPSFLRKSLVPVLLLVMGFVSVGYITLNIQNAGQLKAAAAQEKAAIAAAEQRPMSVPVEADSTLDSMNSPKVNFAKTRGNQNGQEVIQVELKEK